MARSAFVAWVIGAAGSTPAHSVPGVENRPKVAQYVCRVGLMSEAQLDTLAWYDLVLLRDSPATVARIRGRNPGVRLFFNWMPQNISRDWEDQSWWYPDTTWSLIRLSQFYAHRNDWYLRDTQGNRIPEANGYAANWTRYCPRGTYGTSVGRNYVEWLTEVAIPQIITSGRFWPRWGPGSAGYDGLDLEILVDCVGSWGWQNYAEADPDRDGLPEGVYASCESGGADDSLSVLYREMNDLFHEEIARLQDEGVLVLLNAGGKRMGPSWRTDVSGVKLERWMSYLSSPWVDWWESFYGVLSFDETEMLGPGYRWAEDFVGHQGVDSLEGWDQTLLEVVVADSWPLERKERLKRWGLGTSLLGEGFFVYTVDECGLHWQPEFAWDFGQPLGGYAREAYAGPSTVDTLYVRQFVRGFVEVNPHAGPVQGVPAEDARFGFWQTIEDLRADPAGQEAALVRFTGPPQTLSPVDRIELRFARFPIRSENWSEATPYPGGAFTPEPGAAVQATVDGLAPGTTWYFALRNRVHGRWEPGTSNLASIVLPPQNPDQTPPSPIRDLAVLESGMSWIRLGWTAPADEGPSGRASAYRVRYRAGEPISTEADWESAVDAGGVVPTPSAPGSPETYTLANLSAGSVYGLAVRALDEAGNLASVSNPLQGVTDMGPPPPPPPPAVDTIAPSAVGDLAIAELGTTWARLTWVAPGDDGDEGTASVYAVRILAGGPILTEEDWDVAEEAPGNLPSPAAARQSETFRLEGLQPDRLYGFAVRAADEVGNLGALPAPLTARTLPAEPPPPPPPPSSVPRPIEDLALAAADSHSIGLRWTAPDDGEGGPVSQYRLAFLAGDSLRTEEDLARCSVRILGQTPRAPALPESTLVDALEPATLYSFTLLARDEDGEFGGVGNLLHVRTTGSTEPPPPPPDTTPPEAVRDLAAVDVGPAWLRLVWSAPRDEADGRASRYDVRRLAGRRIENEIDWNDAVPLDASALVPRAPGAAESLLVHGLIADSSYGFALRASDARGNLAELSNAVFVVTPLPPDPPPPAAVEDLRVESFSPEELRLSWTTKIDDRPGSLRYRLAIRAGAPIEDEAGWMAADTSRLFTPGDSVGGTRFEVSLAGLSPATLYGLSVRSIDAAGRRSPLPARPLVVTTPALPDSLPPQRIRDLTLADAGLGWLLLRWTAPGDSVTAQSCAAYEIGWLEEAAIETEADWLRAKRLPESPFPPQPPGAPETHRLEGLSAGTRFGLAVRARDASGHLAPISNPLLAATRDEPPPDPPADTTATPDRSPAAIQDLAVAARGPDWAELTWTESGEDSLAGTAASLDLRFLSGTPIRTASDWEAAAMVSPGPTPADGGTARRWRWEGIPAEREGGIALRARDAAGQWSPLVPGAWLSNHASPPPPPPEAPVLSLVTLAPRQAVLALVHGAHGGTREALDRYDARLREDAGDRWETAPVVDPPARGAPGTETRWTVVGLLPDRAYSLGIRAVGAGGGASAFSAVEFRTPSEDLAPPDAPGAPSVAWSPDGAELTLSWPAAADPRVVGYFVYAQGPQELWERLRSVPVTEPTIRLPRPSPQQCRRVGVRSVTADGTESALSGTVDLWVEEWSIEGPIPHPVTDGCRLRVHVPADFPSEAPLRVEIRSLKGTREAVLHDAAVTPGLVLECHWDRRTTAGGVAAPGFHHLFCVGGGQRTLRTIYLAP